MEQQHLRGCNSLTAGSASAEQELIAEVGVSFGGEFWQGLVVACRLVVSKIPNQSGAKVYRAYQPGSIFNLDTPVTPTPTVAPFSLILGFHV